MKIEIWNWTAYLWDCLEIMDFLIKEWVKVDCVLTDPPYGDNKVDNKINSWFKTKELYLKFIKSFILKSKELLKQTWNIAIFCDEKSNYKIRQILDDIFWEDLFINELIWLYWAWWSSKKKPFATKHDTILIYWKTKKYNFNLLKENWVRVKDWLKIKSIADKSWYLACDEENRCLTPYQKPKKLLEIILKWLTNEWDIILDPFWWSWTLWVACQNTNRKFILIEKNETYFNVWISRLKGTKKY